MYGHARVLGCSRPPVREREDEGQRERESNHDDYDSGCSPTHSTRALLLAARTCARVRVCILYIDAALETCPISVYVPSSSTGREPSWASFAALYDAEFFQTFDLRLGLFARLRIRA